MRILPKPTDLGFSKEKYPVRYFLNEARKWLSSWPRVSDIFYWIRTHTKDRYHILNLKEAEPENKDGYRWGLAR